MRILTLIIFMLSSLPLWGQHNHAGHEVKKTEKKAAKIIHKKTKKKEEPRVPIEVPPEQQSRIGLKTTIVEEESVVHTIRTIGTVETDQRNEAHIHPRINGWIEHIFADYVGAPVTKGGKLFSLYSPELLSTQEEYIAAIKQGGVGREIAKAALDRLRLWGVPDTEIQRLVKTKQAQRAITFESPVKGFVIEKKAIHGMYVTPGMELYLIADLSEVWIMVTLYEYDVSVISLGDVAEVELPYSPEADFKAKVTYISPEVEVETRTVKARLEVNNKDQKLKPGMFANVVLKKDLGKSVVVPDDAVIDTGLRKIVFIKKGTARFEPREVRIGPRVNGKFIVLEGLKAKEEVVTSAHFFIDSESKLRAAIEKGSPASSGHGGH